MAITLSYADACSLLKKYSMDELLNLDKIYEDQEKRELQKKLDALQKRVIQLENQTCLYEKGEHKKKHRFTYDIEKLLRVDCGLSTTEIHKVYKMYGQWAGARNYALRMLGQEIPIPNDRCDNSRKAILVRYREIRDSEGIKEANNYFLQADYNLRLKEGKIMEGNDDAQCNIKE